MHQFIVRLMIFTVLATNVAWALDDCSSQYSNETSGWAQAGDLFGDNQNNGVCEEPCIGWLQLVAITPATKLYYFPFRRQDVSRLTLSYHSLDQEPPYKPPQI